MAPGFQVLAGFAALRCNMPPQTFTDACAAWHQCTNGAVKEVNGLLSMLHCTTTVQCTIHKGNTMTTRNAIAAIGGFFEVFGSAVAVSRAVEANQQPCASDLRTLGIDPIAFRKIVRR